MTFLLWILAIFPFMGWLILKALILIGLHDPHLGYWGYMLVGFVASMFLGGSFISFRK